MQTSRREFKTHSLLFPNVFTWVYDAYWGDELEPQSAVDRALLRRVDQGWLGEIEFLERFSRGY